MSGSFYFNIGNLDASLYGNVYNLLDTEYIADANSNFNDAGVATASTATVFYGFGRTYSIGLKVRF